MKTKQLLQQLIDYLDLFEQTVPHAEDMPLSAFLAFVEAMEAEEVTPEVRLQQSIDIARHLSLMHRFSKHYIKRALAISPLLQSEEEYTYLVCLMSGEPMSKSDLHQMNGLEKTTGAEVIRRLYRHGLITEMASIDDKRRVYVAITPRGLAELRSVFPELRIAAELLTSPLEPGQRACLSILLKQMLPTHASAFVSDRETPLSELYQRMQTGVQ